MQVTRRQLFSLRATVGYVVFAGAWILLSDRVLETFSDPHTLARYSTLKGLIFVALTAAILWFTLQNAPPEEDIHLIDEAPRQSAGLQVLWGLLPPLLGGAVQWAIWPQIDPFAWLLLYPAVFTAAWLGGWVSGLLAAALSAAIGWYVFTPPFMAWTPDKPTSLIGIGVFFAMSTLLSLIMAWLRKAEHRAGNSKFEALVEQTLAGIYIIQGERFRYVNPEFARMLGYASPDEIINKVPVSAMVSPHDKARVAEHLHKRFDDLNKAVRYGFTAMRRDGDTIELEVHGRGLDTSTGRVIIGLALDVSERRQTEHALHEKQALLDRMSALAKVGGWRMEVGTKLGTRTDGAARILDLDPSQPGSLSFRDGLSYFKGEHHAQITQAIQRAVQQGQPYALELELISAKGVRKWIRTQGEPIWEDGRVVRIEGAIQDISEVQQARAALQAHQEMLEQTVRERTAELEVARQEAVQLARIKSEFLANMSHEIRTPLNGVLGLAQIGYRDHKGPARQVFEQIIASGRLLLGIINDILDFSKIEAGKLRIEYQPLDLHQLLRRAIQLVQDKANEKGLDLIVEIDPELPVSCLGDALRLEQILLNLLSNAVKFTTHGAVRLAACAREDRLVLSVTDTGIGMTPAQLQGLFRPFEQADGSTTRQYGGTGLGLSITKRLVEMLDGAIDVRSNPGQGTCFEVVLPLVLGEQAAAPSSSAWMASAPAPLDGAEAPRAPRLAGVRVLAAEDNLVNQMVLSELLDYEGAQVTMSESGSAAISQLAQHGAQAFDLVLMDIQMPGMDGYEATRQIKAMAPGLPVIGQTAHAMAEEHAKCHEAGMVDLVIKPIELEALVRTIRRHVPASPAAPR
ncbi:ATP-binding protein [Aquabacterium sp. NJ1]|uniref:ATP-binding protein n=1 Tax=Aquabacterium sp. NJ1 TaxID=1538295 RepID=UPI0006917A59|nr:ATP-binding protein [Aquabacterium sp. NJ1]